MTCLLQYDERLLPSLIGHFLTGLDLLGHELPEQRVDPVDDGLLPARHLRLEDAPRARHQLLHVGGAERLAVDVPIGKKYQLLCDQSALPSDQAFY